MKLAVLFAIVLPFRACVNWHDGRGWHRAQTGMEEYLAENARDQVGYGRCSSVNFPGVRVDSARWKDGPAGEAPIFNEPDCLGDIESDIREAMQTAALTPGDLPDPRNAGPLRILLIPGRFTCGKDFHETTHCTDGSAVFVSWWSMRRDLELAFRDLLAARILGEEL